MNFDHIDRYTGEERSIPVSATPDGRVVLDCPVCGHRQFDTTADHLARRFDLHYDQKHLDIRRARPHAVGSLTVDHRFVTQLTSDGQVAWVTCRWPDCNWTSFDGSLAPMEATFAERVKDAHWQTHQTGQEGASRPHDVSDAPVQPAILQRATDRSALVTIHDGVSLAFVAAVLDAIIDHEPGCTVTFPPGGMTVERRSQ